MDTIFNNGDTRTHLGNELKPHNTNIFTDNAFIDLNIIMNSLFVKFS